MQTGRPFTTSKGGTQLPRPIASLVSMPGTAEPSPRPAYTARGAASNHFAAYVAKVRVSVRAGKITIVREGSGMGEGVAPTPGKAHELALKGAETDATKRALATFGNPFGLALYDREKASVRKPRNERPAATERDIAGPWVLRSATGSPQATLAKAR